MGFSKNTQATRSTLMSVDSTLSENITAAQNYIPIASTTNFSTSVVAEIETTNEVVSFTDISQNLIGLTEDITNLNQWWGQVSATVTVNDTTAPDGTTTADKWVPDNLAATSYFFKSSSYLDFAANVTNTIPKTVTSSIFVKSVGLTAVRTDSYDATTGSSSSVFNLSDGTVTSDTTGTAAITAFPDSWYRIQQTHVFGSTTSAQVQFGRNTVTGNGTDGLYFWGAQIEEGTTASTYIPNTAQTTNTMQGLTDVTRGVNGTTATLASSGDAIQQLPYALSEVNMPSRLKAISVSSDGTGAGRFTLCDKIGTTLCDIDIPDTRIYDLSFGGGIIFPNGIYVSNSDNITGYTLYTDKHSGAAL